MRGGSGRDRLMLLPDTGGGSVVVLEKKSLEKREPWLTLEAVLGHGTGGGGNMKLSLTVLDQITSKG